ncbi:HtaA domain-containing protein [Streptomyces sp. NPDC091292]|uniref:HtaA domain-containing protein n=1 Tax=Streptomyces sp. NPDC091292 TaxID=3365991 RepID=UPI0038155E07
MAATRRPTALVVTAATAVTLGATALALPAFAAPAAGPAAAGAPPIALKNGTLDWGFKESFRKYLLSPIAHGKITVGDGAVQAPDNGPFTFKDGAGSYDTGTHGTNTAFKGSVRFEGHEGVLDIKLSDLKVTTSGTTGTISSDVTTVKDGTPTTQNDLVIADLDLTGIRPGTGAGGAMVFKDIPAKLTAAGSAAFQNFYQAGSALDPATLTVTPVPPATDSASPSTPPPTSPPPTATPSTEPSTTPSGGTPTGDPSPTETSGTESPAPGTVVGGTLSWGLKESFRTYIRTGGEIKLAGGAKDNGNGFDFPYAKADLDSDAKKLSAAFDGSAQFVYSGHGIDMTFGDVRIEASGSKGTLTVDVKTAKGTNEDVPFATLDLSKASYTAKDDVVLLDKVPAAFTAEGAEQFANDTTGSLYKEGQAIDPVTIALALSKDAVLPGGSGGSASGGTTGGGGSVGGLAGGSGSLASTGTDIPSTALLAGAGAIAAAGAAVFLSVRRRRPQQEV